MSNVLTRIGTGDFGIIRPINNKELVATSSIIDTTYNRGATKSKIATSDSNDGALILY